MAFYIQLNENNILTGSPSTFTIGDINQCVSGNQGRFFTCNGVSSPCNIQTVYNNLISGGYSENTIVLNTATLNDCLNNPNGTNRALLDGSFGWLFGSVETGGVAFRRIVGSSTAVTKIELRLGPNGDYTGGGISAFNIGTTCGVGSGSNADNNWYWFDNWFYNGVYQDTDTFVCGGAFNIEYVEIGLDSNPLYEVIAENTIDNVLSYSGGDLYERPLFRRCPNLYTFGQGGRIGKENITFFKEGFQYTPDPQGDGGETQPEGGEGTPQSSVPIDYPDLPPDDIMLTGIVRMYNPTTSQLASIYNYIYSSPQSVIDNFKKIWYDPMQSIISLTTVPFLVNVGASENVYFCGVDTGVSSAILAGQFQVVDCGTCTIEEEYKSFVEYEPYTTASLYLPFIGFVDLKPSDVIGATVGVKYNIDLLTGECLAFVKIHKNVGGWNVDIDSVMYAFKGNVISSYPLTGNNWSNMYSGIAQTVMGIGGAIAGNPSALGGIVNGILQPMVSTSRSGAVSGNSGALGEYRPYICFEKPIINIPTGNQFYMGYPTNYGKDALEKYHKYTEVDTSTLKFNVNVNYITADEIDEIKQLLEGGVILP